MHIRISLPAQTLELYGADSELLRRYAVSSAANGPGEQSGSFCTPRGRHIIRAKVGAGATANTVFVSRRPTGELWTPELAAAHPQRDWILTRILWLSGCEPGFNRLGKLDTMRRYIYIHGSPDGVPLGTPSSIGCIRMRNADIVELFDRVPPYTPVDIVEFRVKAGDWKALGAIAMPLRERVFVIEQGVPLEIEQDEYDASSRHVVAFGPQSKPIGTGRLLPHGHIGRMAVLRDWRGRGVGSALLESLLELAARHGKSMVRLNAQTHAARFYEQFGFVAEGEVFMEAGIAHVSMHKALRPA